MKKSQKFLTAVGFEPTPFRTGAFNQRLRPLGHAALVTERMENNLSGNV